MIQEKELSEIGRHLHFIQLVEPESWPDARHLKSTEGFILSRTGKMDDDVLTYTAQITKNGDYYCLKGYEASMLRVPPIVHGNFDGVDTRVLEQQMKQVKWRSILPPVGRAQQEVTELLDRLFRLAASANEAAADLADRLMLKYLAGTPLEEQIAPIPNRKQFEKNLFIRLNKNANDLNIHEAYNLLCGRSVARLINPEMDKNDLCWLKDIDGRIARLPDFGMATAIDRLPFEHKPDIGALAGIMVSLSAGERLSNVFRIKDTTASAFFEADALNGQIALYDPENRRINLKEEKVKRNALPIRNSVKRQSGKGSRL